MAKGYEVLYLTEAIDEAVVTNMGKFMDKELADVTKEGLQVRAVIYMYHEHQTALSQTAGMYTADHVNVDCVEITTHLCFAPMTQLFLSGPCLSS